MNIKDLEKLCNAFEFAKTQEEVSRIWAENLEFILQSREMCGLMECYRADARARIKATPKTKKSG